MAHRCTFTSRSDGSSLGRRAPLLEPTPADTINVVPGERYTVLYRQRSQAWHGIVTSSTTPKADRLFGMVTALIVEA